MSARNLPGLITHDAELFLGADLCVSFMNSSFVLTSVFPVRNFSLVVTSVFSDVFQLVRTWRTRLSVRNAEPTPGPDTSMQALRPADVSKNI